MIFYFSATGNSKYVADRVAEATNDHTVSIVDCLKRQACDFDVTEEKQVGIVCPTYCWGLPNIVAEFLKKLVLNEKPKYLWLLTTYGSTTGQIARFADEILGSKGLKLHGSFCVKMPDTWTPIFDLSDQEKVRQINEIAELRMDFAIHCIRSGLKDDFMIHKVPYIASKFYYNVGFPAMRKTSHFHVEDSCVGCGLCAKNCPAEAIHMENGKPVWVKKQCEICLACLHHCPKFSIQYGRRTKNHGQYSHAPYKKEG